MYIALYNLMFFIYVILFDFYICFYCIICSFRRGIFKHYKDFNHMVKIC